MQTKAEQPFSVEFQTKFRNPWCWQYLSRAQCLSFAINRAGDIIGGSLYAVQNRRARRRGRTTVHVIGSDLGVIYFRVILKAFGSPM